jgi:hypothetical protein
LTAAFGAARAEETGANARVVALDLAGAWRGRSDLDSLSRTTTYDSPDAAGAWRWRSDEVVLPSDGSGAVDRLTLSVGGPLRGPTGAPLYYGPTAGAVGETQVFDLNYTRGWPAAMAVDSGRYRLDLTPHAGVGWTSEGGSAEAGATLRFGERDDEEDGLSRLGVGDGERFGGKARWYVFAAASSRAVGYNFMKDDEGWKRSGVSTDTGAFVGDQQAGVAWRKGDLQASFGWMRRTVRAPGVRRMGSADESMVGFQVSIKPGR